MEQAVFALSPPTGYLQEKLSSLRFARDPGVIWDSMLHTTVSLE
jgi:hypothetical protein